jgi:hypothetical protein
MPVHETPSIVGKITRPLGERRILFHPFEVRGRRRGERFSEHRNECSRGAVPGFVSGVRDFGSLGQEPHRLHKAKLLPPLSSCHTYFFLYFWLVVGYTVLRGHRLDYF